LIIFYFFAIISTLFRLIYRSRCRQLWWDDFWASIALINTILLFSATFECHLTFLLLGLPLLHLASRLSVAVTVVRIIATGTSLLVSKIVSVMFGLLAIAIIIQRLVLCSHPGEDFLCRDMSKVTGYTELSASFFSDIWLLGAPAYLLWNMKLKKQFHRLLQAIFATEILVLVTSIIHCVYIVRNDYRSEGVILHFKTTTSLIVCNLLFLVTYMYKLYRDEQDYSEESTTTAPLRQMNTTSSHTTTEHHIQTEISPLTSAFISSSSYPNMGTSCIVPYESEPGVVEREWTSVGLYGLHTRSNCQV
ncbi:hypothetical protein BDQ17DRAFT_1243700, partial [Cyathus striatus]